MSEWLHLLPLALLATAVLFGACLLGVTQDETQTEQRDADSRDR